jgi:hypothetical protein
MENSSFDIEGGRLRVVVERRPLDDARGSSVRSVTRHARGIKHTLVWLAPARPTDAEVRREVEHWTATRSAFYRQVHLGLAPSPPPRAPVYGAPGVTDRLAVFRTDLGALARHVQRQLARSSPSSWPTADERLTHAYHGGDDDRPRPGDAVGLACATLVREADAFKRLAAAVVADLMGRGACISKWDGATVGVNTPDADVVAASLDLEPIVVLPETDAYRALVRLVKVVGGDVLGHAWPTVAWADEEREASRRQPLTTPLERPPDPLPADQPGVRGATVAHVAAHLFLALLGHEPAPSATAGRPLGLRFLLELDDVDWHNAWEVAAHMVDTSSL